jgi:hypothetical protein
MGYHDGYPIRLAGKEFYVEDIKTQEQINEVRTCLLIAVSRGEKYISDGEVLLKILDTIRPER